MNYNGPERRQIVDEASKQSHFEISKSFTAIEINLSAINMNIESLKNIVENQNHMLFGETGVKGVVERIGHAERFVDEFKDHVKSDNERFIAIFGLLVAILGLAAWKTING